MPSRRGASPCPLRAASLGGSPRPRGRARRRRLPRRRPFTRAVEGSASIFARELGDGARGWAATYRPHGRPWRPGERVRLPALAATLERLAAAGAHDLYSGELAARQAAGLAAAGSEITAADLAANASTWETPLSLDYRGALATTHPPNSSGLVGLEILNILRALEPPDPASFVPGEGGATAGADLRWAHLGIEATKRALADRDTHLSDPAFVDIPVGRLLDPAYGEALARAIDPGRATLPRPPGRRRAAARSGWAWWTRPATR